MERRSGVALPPFIGPLTAFEATRDPGRPAAIYLGGDLHAIHPDAADRAPSARHDDSLEAATVVLEDLEHDSLWATASEGIWCLRLPAEMLGAAPYFSLFDTEGRLRHWLILPPARQMIGVGHLWLPFVRPLPTGRGGAP